MIALPWQVSVVLACVVFAVLRWLIPAVFAGSPLLASLAATSHSVAWLALPGFGVLGVLAFMRARSSTKVDTRSNVKTRSAPVSNGGAVRPSGKKYTRHSDTVDARRADTAPAPATGIPDTWSLEALQSLEWKRFELLCAKYYEAMGFRSETLRCGADGGIDVKLFKTDSSIPMAVVQCKAWNSQSVGVKEIRELLGVMAHEKVERGIFLTTATYTKDALEFGAANPIQLLDGASFLSRLQALPLEQQDMLLKYAFDGDYRTPSCPSCGIKLIRRDSKRGAFWGCVNYPRCRSTLAIKAG